MHKKIISFDKLQTRDGIKNVAIHFLFIYELVVHN
jgi:hypothetical protein